MIRDRSRATSLRATALFALAAIAVLSALAGAAGCAGRASASAGGTAAGAASGGPGAASGADAAARPALPERESATARRVALAAMAQVGVTISYDAAYHELAYPGGDVPRSTGTCADVVVRAYRAVGIDLQQKVHEDMTAHFSAYPQLWGLSHADSNIDHRRVPNLATYFARHGARRAVSRNGADWWPGDVVVWSVNGRPHTGVVSVTPAPDGTHFLVAHNIGMGTQIEDVLFAYQLVGHYRSF